MKEFKITAQDFMDIFIVQTVSTIRTKEDAKENCYFANDENEWRIRSESSVWGSLLICMKIYKMIFHPTYYYARRLGSRALCDGGNITLSCKLDDRMKQFVNGHVKNIMDSSIIEEEI